MTNKLKGYAVLALYLGIIFGLLYLHQLAMNDPAETVEWAHQLSQKLTGN